MGTQPELMTTEESAEFLRTTPATLHKWAYRSEGPRYFKVGRRRLYRRSELLAWLEAQASTAA